MEIKVKRQPETNLAHHTTPVATSRLPPRSPLYQCCMCMERLVGLAFHFYFHHSATWALLNIETWGVRGDRDERCLKAEMTSALLCTFSLLFPSPVPMRSEYGHVKEKRGKHGLGTRGVTP